MFAASINECPPLGAPQSQPAEWRFLERYPELAFYLRDDPATLQRIEARYRQIQEFALRHIAPHALEIDLRMAREPDYLPHDLLKKACDYRLYSMMFPKALGGSGEHIITAFMAYELIASHCVGIANLLGVSGLAIACVLSTFDPRALAVIADLIVSAENRGEPVFLSTCVTEPGAGSDAEDADEFSHAQLRTTARKVAGGYRLNGNKVFISNGCLAAMHVVIAYDAAGRHRPEDMLVLLVPKDSPGLSIPRNEHKMGQRVCPASEVVFDDVFVPDARVCRKTSKRDEYAHTGIANVLGLTRAGVGSFATGVAENAYRTALAFVRNHSFLGQPMEQQQWVRVELAHLARRAQMARATYLNALLAVASVGLAEPMLRMPNLPIPNWLNQHPVFSKARHSLLASDQAEWLFKRVGARQQEFERDIATGYGDVAKVSCSELAMENCQKAISLMGKGGLRHEHGAEKLLRDVKLLQIYEGTNQVNMLDMVKRRVSRQFISAAEL
jgi:alkylation response protein AidB-like acyl-CoA dehydrogenase